MILTINGKECELKFGFAFIKKINQIAGFKDSDGTEMGQGLERITYMLMQEEPEAVVSLILAATDHLKKRPTGAEIESYLETVEDYEGLLKQFDEELSKATPLGVAKRYTKTKKQATELIAKAQAKAEAQAER